MGMTSLTCHLLLHLACILINEVHDSHLRLRKKYFYDPKKYLTFQQQSPNSTTSPYRSTYDPSDACSSKHFTPSLHSDHPNASVNKSTMASEKIRVRIIPEKTQTPALWQVCVFFWFSEHWKNQGEDGTPKKHNYSYTCNVCTIYKV